jgi:hypothetical protein
MKGPSPRTSWIVAPPEMCVLCREPLVRPEDASSWNGRPAHRDCVRAHLIQRDPAFRDWGGEEPTEEPSENADELGAREDDDDDIG